MAKGKGEAHATNILDALAGAAKPLSAYDLLERLRPTGVAAPLTIYRALDRLIKAGKVHRIESLNAFVACRAGEPHGHDHPEAEALGRTVVGFAICDGCGRVDEFVDGALGDLVARAMLARGFAPRSSAVEVHGLCNLCGCDAVSDLAGIG